MKGLKTYLKAIALFFILIMMFQSCVAYHSSSVSLDQAYQVGLKTKVVSSAGKKYNFRRITFEDGKFYGIQKSHGELTKVPLNEKDLAKILLKNEGMSTLLTIGASIVSVFGVLLIWFLIDTGGGDLYWTSG